MNVKGCEKVNKQITKWLRKRGFKCKAEMDTDFSYLIYTDVLKYSFFVSGGFEDTYIDFCKSLYPELISCDIFLLSFFHELGHRQTLKNFSYQEIKQYDNFHDELENKLDRTEEDVYNYYMHPIELAATKWGIEYMLKFPKAV